uniref:Uncharacterized protein n=1 Tax=Meloidogyne enterolobii TaxID=390850 RepID=A0A6V7X1N8_MELEN|nr:unnamed protein product [Meloidogyne enterolobii]
MMEKLLLPQILSIARIQPPCVRFHWNVKLKTSLVLLHASMRKRTMKMEESTLHSYKVRIEYSDTIPFRL